MLTRPWRYPIALLMLTACSGPAADAGPSQKPQPSAHDRASSSQPSSSPALTRLIKAAAADDWVMVKALLDQGVDVNGVDPLDPHRNTALHAAVDPGHFTVAKLLFTRGANVAAVNAHGETPVDIARNKKHEAILVLLSMRKASEVLLKEPVARPLDPARLDPGALMKKIEEVTAPPAAPTAAVAAEKPSAAPTAPLEDEKPSSAPTPAAPAETAEAAQRKRELCAQVETAMAQLRSADEAEIEELGVSRQAAIDQLQATIGDSCD